MTGRMGHVFVEFIPERLEANTLYVSIEYSTAAHLCACGCQREVVTPLSPTDWRFTYDGVSVSVAPSIGNWSFPCRSHYWIRDGRVSWSRPWTATEIAKGRQRDSKAKREQFTQSVVETSTATPPANSLPIARRPRLGARLRRLWSGESRKSTS